MPAIDIARLRMQIDRLVSLCDRPPLFRSNLRDLFEFYNDLTYRPGQSGKLQSLLPHYKVPPPIIRQIEVELAKFCAQDPRAGLALADALWEDAYLEPRLLAIHLLGAVPVTLPEPVLTRLTAWAQPEEDRKVLDALIAKGTSHLLRHQTEDLSAIIKNWLTSGNLVVQGMGLLALHVIAEDENFEDLPVIFHLISLVIQNLPANLHPDLLAVLQILARRSPSETAYFLRQVLIVSHNRLVPRLVRRCFPYFTEETQDGLRQILKTVSS